MKRAIAAERSKESGIIATSTNRSTFNGGNSGYGGGMKGSSGGGGGGGGWGGSSHLASFSHDDDDDDDDNYIVDPDEEIKRASLLDSMLLFAYMNCSPLRRSSVISLLSSSNRCQIESCSLLLASNGNNYTEALLWLYRSQNQHTRVLQALTEDKCVAIGAWTTEQFYNWTAEYLRWLWYNEDDATLPRQALLALKPVLEYDAEVRIFIYFGISILKEK
jgi:hypothetical protein